MNSHGRKKSKKLIIVLVTVLSAVTVFLLVYASAVYRAEEECLKQVYENTAVTVEEYDGDYIVRPVSGDCETGVILYPGAMVASDSYLALAAELAEEGYVCAVPSAAMYFALADTDAAERIMSLCGDISDWYIGGHSLGGVAASVYASENPDAVSGLVFLASYPNADLGGLPALFVYGSEDGVLNFDKMTESMSYCSGNTEVYEIEGGNHAGFGTYGAQSGDGEAYITGEEQRAQTVRYIKDFIERGGNGNQG